MASAGSVVVVGVVAVAVALGACADDGQRPATEPFILVEVETQRCRQPNRFHGVGIVVGDGLVLTAGHTVEGELRDLRVDGEPATVMTVDLRTDLALVAADTADDVTAPSLATAIPVTATMLGPDGAMPVTIDRAVTLVIEHATDRATYHREVVIFTPSVSGGDSGSPLVDERGDLVGIVVADQQGEGVAVAASEVAALLDSTTPADDLTLPQPPGAC